MYSRIVYIDSSLYCFCICFYAHSPVFKVSFGDFFSFNFKLSDLDILYYSQRSFCTPCVIFSQLHEREAFFYAQIDLKLSRRWSLGMVQHTLQWLLNQISVVMILLHSWGCIGILIIDLFVLYFQVLDDIVDFLKELHMEK